MTLAGSFGILSEHAALISKMDNFLRTFLAVLAMVKVSQASYGSLKSYCLVEDDECDEDWTPFENMASTLVGYDLPKGNPFATTSIEDPGLRKQIFNATWEDLETEDYVMESGITAREYKMCDTEFTNRGATNMKGYEKVRKNL